MQRIDEGIRYPACLISPHTIPCTIYDFRFQILNIVRNVSDFPLRNVRVVAGLLVSKQIISKNMYLPQFDLANIGYSSQLADRK